MKPTLELIQEIPNLQTQRRKTTDIKCYQLAVEFLDDYYGHDEAPARVAEELAAEIQATIENYLEGIGK